MEIKIYLDVLFLTDLIMDLFLLWLLRMILKLKGTWIRLAAGSAAGAFLSALLFYLWLTIACRSSGPPGQGAGTGGFLVMAGWMAAVLGVSSLMLLMAFSFGNVREFLRAEAGLLFAAALTEGILEWGRTAWLALKGEPMQMSALGLLPGLFFLAGGCFLAEGLWKLVHVAAGERSCHYQVTLVCGENTVRAEGFLDTGNRLKDPVSGKPVHVADRQLVEAVCPKVDKISMIPYRTIDGGGMFLKAVTLDRMEASQGGRLLVYERPLVAASPGKLKMKNGCRVLLHG